MSATVPHPLNTSSLSSTGTDVGEGQPIVAMDLDVNDTVEYFIPEGSLNSDRFDIRTEDSVSGTQGVVFLRNGSSLLVGDIIETHPPHESHYFGINRSTHMWNHSAGMHYVNLVEW